MSNDNLIINPVRLKQSTLDAIDKIAREQDRTRAWVMRDILERATKTKTPPK